MKVSLVIMAAGLGSRYGGSKQVDGIGPNGEILMEYSIYDALRAGFNKVVFIIKPEMEEMVRRLCGDALARRTAADGSPVEVAYAFQDFTSVPDFYHIPAERTKPFGTVHALLCAAGVVHEPCCVINADDYYGPKTAASMPKIKAFTPRITAFIPKNRGCGYERDTEYQKAPIGRGFV